jgi:hypothetical protein
MVLTRAAENNSTTCLCFASATNQPCAHAGTGSNIWDMRRGRYLTAPAKSVPGPGGYNEWAKYNESVNSLPEGTFSAGASEPPPPPHHHHHHHPHCRPSPRLARSSVPVTPHCRSSPHLARTSLWYQCNSLSLTQLARALTHLLVQHMRAVAQSLAQRVLALTRLLACYLCSPRSLIRLGTRVVREWTWR